MNNTGRNTEPWGTPLKMPAHEDWKPATTSLQLVVALRSFVIRFDFESYVRFEILFVLMVWFEIFELSALSIVIRKETIGGG